MSNALKSEFRSFLDAEPGRLHFAAHSHHPWPDATREAHQQAWLDAARWADEKWDHVFSEVWPEAQRHVAEQLRLPDPSTLVFAPNTHALVLRLLSVLPEHPTIVTSDSEFHSFERQLRRLEEDGLVKVERVASEPFATFGERLVAAAKRTRPDLVFFSHVFFNSGAVVQGLESIVREIPEDTLVAVDAYHGFLAVPTDLSALATRAFYLAGGYKYAMAGEGACFLHVPPGVAPRPRNTGWYAAFGALEGSVAGQVPYGPGGMRFAGATFDPSALYRLNGVMRWRQRIGLTTEASRAHSHELQTRFVEGLRRLERPRIDPSTLVVPVEDPNRGQFLTFRTPQARELTNALKQKRVITDAREDRLRFGFGVYQDAADVEALLQVIAMLP
ncbi:MAG: aminotransferase class V-fold PLP-dependent enzyme [Myxococcaceae bacterium]